MKEANFDTLITIDEIGPTVASSIINFWSIDINNTVVKNCLDNGIKFKVNDINITPKLAGVTFVFTGTMKILKRKTAKENADPKEELPKEEMFPSDVEDEDDLPF